jgi:hypothetical protein
MSPTFPTPICRSYLNNNHSSNHNKTFAEHLLCTTYCMKLFTCIFFFDTPFPWNIKRDPALYSWEKLLHSGSRLREIWWLPKICSLLLSDRTRKEPRFWTPGCLHLHLGFGIVERITCRTSYIICGVQCKIKTQALCSKFIKNFNMVIAHLCLSQEPCRYVQVLAQEGGPDHEGHCRNSEGKTWVLRWGQ